MKKKTWVNFDDPKPEEVNEDGPGDNLPPPVKNPPPANE